MIRRTFFILALLAIGATISLAIASLCALFSPLTPRGSLRYDSPLSTYASRPPPPASLRAFVPNEWLELDPGDQSLYQILHNRSTGPGVTLDAVLTDLQHVGMNTAGFGDRMALRLRAGWPAPVLRCTGIADPLPFAAANAPPVRPAWQASVGKSTQPMTVYSDWAIYKVKRPVPIAIDPVGLAINSSVFAAFVLLPIIFTIPMRRNRRMLRGLCPRCKYPVAGMQQCPECGWNNPLVSSRS